ncbi:uncharacterized protein [Rutidosis leptorrhynchoides]|uniref:uncharacterized protein n=1 Tax=Rutidosis leptorrhynchoides TaxID=125765 RepID=UPI003A9A2C4A
MPPKRKSASHFESTLPSVSAGGCSNFPPARKTGVVGSSFQLPSSLDCPVMPEGVTGYYNDIGDCNCVCYFCGAYFWYEERVKSSSVLRFNGRCEGGRVDLPRERNPPPDIVELLKSRNYVDNIRAYNQMFSMASYGAQIDDTINNSRGPYVFKIVGQVYHWIVAICPEDGDPPRFLQLYIYDTDNEVRNRLNIFGERRSGGVSEQVVELPLHILNDKNEVVKLFRIARDRILGADVPEFQIRLYNVIGAKQYEMPVTDTLGAIVFKTGDRTRTDYDLIVEYKGGTPKRVNKLHLMSGRGDHYRSDVGSQTILPASFTGGPRYLAKYNNITPSDRADILSRVFHLKINEYVIVLKVEDPFGLYRAILYTIEFQKRGLPHCHTLLWVQTSARSLTPEDVDRFIAVELPNLNRDPVTFIVISDLMIHGPRGKVNEDAPCMQQHKCKKRFPKPFNNTTYFDKDGFIHYRRRNTGISVDKTICHLDNGYVVPYKSYLCLRFHAHINVECCGWNMLIKYLFKYISKGTDRVATHISRPLGDEGSSRRIENQAVDEIKNFIDARFICPHEASWRIYNFPINYREPAVQVLITLEGKKTTLTEWLEYNKSPSDGRHLTYLDFPGKFVWVSNEKRWKRRCNLNKPSIGRLSYMHPAFGEVFYLRMLLCHKKGCTSYTDLLTIGQTTYHTYRETCLAMGLLGDNKEWKTALEEASATATAAELRTLFSHILIYCDVANPLRLWK